MATIPNNDAQRAESHASRANVPSVSLPKGGGAIRGIGEKFAANPVTGTGSLSVPIFTSPGRSGFGPQLSLSYDSGSGNGPFGLGWNSSLPSITRKTDKGLPTYRDSEESDVFTLSGAEDLVPVLVATETEWLRESSVRPLGGASFKIEGYRPRIEGLFARIERWTNAGTKETHWRSISGDNVTTLYGTTAESRIADPAKPDRVFSWLICESYDDQGNAILYEYAPEDSSGVDRSEPHERNRTPESRAANRYLKRIRYGNQTSRLIEPDLARMDWLFEVVLDYDEGHCETLPVDDDRREFVTAAKDPTRHWSVRQDPFSNFRAGFDLRTYRLCNRILMFHHFPDELGTVDYLVRSTEFTYSRGPIASFMTSVSQSGYVRNDDGTYLKRSMPPLEFGYTAADLKDEIMEIDPRSLENLPYGLDGTHYQWADLDGEGLSGILAEHREAWSYKANLGSGVFGPLATVVTMPSGAASGKARAQLIDLAGDGQLDLVEFSGPSPGFYERTPDRTWERFVPFQFLPRIDWSSPNLRFVDLNGDGHTDILITEDEALTWYPSLGEEGFGRSMEVRLSADEERGPKLVFADNTESIHLADMSGDGLPDLMRIRNGEVSYWPNLGYGRFGARVTMGNAPSFDSQDEFRRDRIHLADIDGSGVTDIIYMGRSGAQIYFNQSGNSWSDLRKLTTFPDVDNVAAVAVADLLGDGTACIIWSSALPANARKPMLYIDLMGGIKPHLLFDVRNNMGAEIRVEYAPSTRFYLADREAGEPWITRLPFPVHVVERVQTYDRISRNRFVTRYAYHHGYFDGEEREFRGFGRVDQWDTEEFAALTSSDAFPAGSNINEASHIPPVLTRSWFHTGAFSTVSRISRLYEAEYYREPGLTDDEHRAMLLTDTILPLDLSAQEDREACRALKGLPLRQEVYALDDSSRSAHPYSVSEQSYDIKRLQPLRTNRHAVFFAHSREVVEYHYERNPADPRVSHQLTLEVDAFGNVKQSAAIGYGRRQADPALGAADQAKQAQTLITCAQSAFTEVVDLDDAYRTPLPCETRTFHLTGLGVAAGSTRYSFEEVVRAFGSAATIAYEVTPTPDSLQKRVIEHVRTLYLNNDLSGPLDLYRADSRGLAFESYQLALTPDLIEHVYDGRVTDSMLEVEGGYVHFGDEADWWIPSGRVFYSPNEGDSPGEELSFAELHFFIARRFRDPFGSVSTVGLDVHDLLIAETFDPVGNEVRADNDYRVLQPTLVTDPNRNRAAVRFDALGFVVGTAVMGKGGEDLGDSLDGFEPDLVERAIAAHIEVPLANPDDILGTATARLVYDLFRYQRSRESESPLPTVVYTLTRETHNADLEPDEVTDVQHRFSYSDGFGREIQMKIQAERLTPVDEEAGVEPRWVGSGWTIFNNKGKPVKQYEPFFGPRHEFEFERLVGVGSTLFYDPLERVVATLHPNNTYEKTVFDPWRQRTWDVNDTVLEDDPGDDPDVGDFFRRLTVDEYLPTWHAARVTNELGSEEQTAAAKAAAHAETSTVAHFDTLGRAFLTIADNGAAGFFATRVELDIEGNQRWVTDALDRIVASNDFDITGTGIRHVSMEAGTRWALNDVTGNPIYGWDNRDHTFRTAYDGLRRPTEVFLREGVAAELLVENVIYGEDAGDEFNHRGRMWRRYDGAGVLTNRAYDFKGNPVRSTLTLAVDYKNTIDWSTAVALEDETLTSSNRYDALNRPVALTSPDGSVIRPSFNEAGLLERIDVNLRGADASTVFVSDIDYDAKGQRTRILYGNGVVTTYDYDERTFRLVRLETRRGGTALQDLRYTYDPVGNLTAIRDAAQQSVYYDNGVVDARSDFTYDAIYRLIDATGREHIGQLSQPETTWDDRFRVSLAHPHDAHAMRPYSESYVYDEVGNILRLRHAWTGDSWTREYHYDEPSIIEPEKNNNRLSRTSVGAAVEPYTHDAHGNITSMAHLPLMQWNFRDHLEATSKQVVVGGGTPETTYYVYDASGQRVRKVTEGQAVAGAEPSRVRERIYLGGFEVYREYTGGGSTVTLQRETLSISDDSRRVAMVETRTEGSDDSPARLIRYQFDNHIGSASLELDEDAQVISYEEYYPYGSTSYQAVRSGLEANPKRYRYTGMERDEETGLNYHTARYYAPWLGRWTAPDPAGLQDGINAYAYVKCNPLNGLDPSGLQEVTIYHRAPQRAADAMVVRGASTQASRGHVWAGRGFYGSSDPSIPASSGARGAAILEQRVSTARMATITDARLIRMLQDTPEGAELRRLTWRQIRDQQGVIDRSRAPIRNMRDYMSRELDRLHPNADVIRWQNPNGNHTYVVRRQGALIGNPRLAGTVTAEGRFTALVSAASPRTRASTAAASAESAPTAVRRAATVTEGGIAGARVVTTPPRTTATRPPPVGGRTAGTATVGAMGFVAGIGLSLLLSQVEHPPEIDLLVSVLGGPAGVITHGISQVLDAASLETRCGRGEDSGGTFRCTTEMRRQYRAEQRAESDRRWAEENGLTLEDLSRLRREDPPSFRVAP